jgi:hypothetical protein
MRSPEMPDREKLTPELMERILSGAPAGNWVIARVSDGRILGTGPDTVAARRHALENGYLLDDGVALLWSSGGLLETA